jgi:hypothetical protein
MANDETLQLKVDIPKSMYPRLYDLLKNIPQRMRSEKLRQLASISEMVESGLIEDIGEMLQRKISFSLIGSSPALQVPAASGVNDRSERGVIDAGDFSGFDSD